MAFDYGCLDLADFGLDELAISIVSEFDNKFYLAEKYKFAPIDRVVQAYNDACYTDNGHFPDAVFEYKEDRGDAVLSPLGAVLTEVNQESKEVTVLVCCEEDTAVLDEIMLSFWEYKATVVWLTLYNFQVLTGDSKASYLHNPGVLFKRVVVDALQHKATDVHFKPRYEVTTPVMEIRYRVGSSMIDSNLFTLGLNEQKSLIKFVTDHYTNSQSLDLMHEKGVTTKIGDVFGDGKVSMRVAALKASGDTLYLVGRLQQEETFSFTIGTLGFSHSVQRVLRQLSTKRNGLTLITGSIRTGKNTTAFAMANEMVKEPVNIISYESPIEVFMPFTQIEYNGDGADLANAIRLAKKQDVDIAFLNEIPDKSVAFAVQDLVNSSVHVVTTFHMDRLYHLPYKLRELYGEEYKNVISQINAVINQKMFSKACPRCRTQVSVEVFRDELYYDLLRDRISVPCSTGCEHCDGHGELKSSNQPYVEFVYFTNEIKSELLGCSTPYEMEVYLKKILEGTKSDFESVITRAIDNDELQPRCLNSIV